jgi:hypothetical protein
MQFDVKVKSITKTQKRTEASEKEIYVLVAEAPEGSMHAGTKITIKQPTPFDGFLPEEKYTINLVECQQTLDKFGRASEIVAQNIADDMPDVEVSLKGKRYVSKKKSKKS